MLDFARQAQRDFLFWTETAITVDDETRADFPRIRAILEKYGDLPADFADASLVALCNGSIRVTSPLSTAISQSIAHETGVFFIMYLVISVMPQLANSRRADFAQAQPFLGTGWGADAGVDESPRCG